MTDELDNLAREIAEGVIAERIAPLIGKNYKDKMPAIKQRIAFMRAGTSDELPEVKAARLGLEAGIKLGREQAAGVIAAKVAMYNAKAAKRDPFADDVFNSHDMSNEIAIGLEFALAEIRTQP